MSPDQRRIPVQDLALFLTRSSRRLHPRVSRLNVSFFVHTITDTVSDMRSKYVPGEKVTEDSSRVLTVPEALEVLEQLKDGVGEVQAFSEHHHLDPTSRQLRRLDRAGEVFDAAKEFVHKRKKRRFF